MKMKHKALLLFLLGHSLLIGQIGAAPVTWVAACDEFSDGFEPSRQRLEAMGYRVIGSQSGVNQQANTICREVGQPIVGFLVVRDGKPLPAGMWDLGTIDFGARYSVKRSH